MEHHRGPDMTLMAPGLRNHFVYHIVDKAGQVIYVGCTRRPEKRWSDHRQNPLRRDMIAAAKQFKMFGPYDFPTARRIEREHTFDLRPKFNKIPVTRDRKEAAWYLTGPPPRPYIDGTSSAQSIT